MKSPAYSPLMGDTYFLTRWTEEFFFFFIFLSSMTYLGWVSVPIILNQFVFVYQQSFKLINLVFSFQTNFNQLGLWKPFFLFHLLNSLLQGLVFLCWIVLFSIAGILYIISNSSFNLFNFFLYSVWSTLSFKPCPLGVPDYTPKTLEQYIPLVPNLGFEYWLNDRVSALPSSTQNDVFSGRGRKTYS